MIAVVKVVAFLLSLSNICLAVTTNTTFTQASLCDIEDRVKHQCMKQVAVQGSIVQCCIQCALDSSCLGASLNKTVRACFLHTPCPAVGNCSGNDTVYKYFQKQPQPDALPCVKGTWDSSTKKCVCDIHHVGKLCDRRPYNCSDFHANHPKAFGYYELFIHPPNFANGIGMDCWITATDVRTIFFRNAGEMNFNRSWTEYVNGFFINKSTKLESRWLGLEMMYDFLSKVAVKRLGLRAWFKDKTIEHIYSNIILSDSSANYSLYIPPQVPVNSLLGDCLSPNNTLAFSTWDAVNNEGLTESCVAQAGAGWWFSRCDFTCNPLGNFYNTTPSPPSEKDYIALPGFDEQYISNSLIHVEMFMIEH